MAAMNKPAFDAILTHAIENEGDGSLGAGGVYSADTREGEAELSTRLDEGAKRRGPLSRPVLVFVASRRQTRVTAKELIALLHMHSAEGLFLNCASDAARTDFDAKLQAVKVNSDEERKRNAQKKQGPSVRLQTRVSSRGG